MSVGRLALWVTTAFVALIVALAVPVSQLRLVSETKACCCPDPRKCHCPDHKGGDPAQDTMRACHTEARLIVSPEAPAVAVPSILIVPATVVSFAPATFLLSSPHAPPPPARPDAPS
ncbi:MAG: hypothetical protein IPQ07_22985 [Myxococcales bacterium]|nr:hypothetical protein [Myxococcales bacterium]